MQVITLLTDFGTGDEYVGAMKGVILSGHPQATIVDISHQIAPQDIEKAAYMIPAYAPCFPAQTVHVVVVDPGVGSDRAILALACDKQIFMGPDNGVLSLILARDTVERIVRVEDRSYFLPDFGATFHGRDIFAPIAAHLSRGLPLTELGPEIQLRQTVRLDLKPPVVDARGRLEGTIIAVDRFGNAITNIDRRALERVSLDPSRQRLKVHVGRYILTGLSRTYADVGQGEPLVLFGSRGYLEIAVNGGDAARVLKLVAGERVWAEAGR